MKVTLYMAITANGIIAKNDDSADFLTKEESASYVKTVISAGALVIGRRTYEILSEQPEFQEFLKAGVKMVAVSTQEFKVLDSKHAVAKSPKEALETLKDREEVVLAGGSILNAEFMKEGLVDELYLDIEPAIVGKGIPLFQSQEFDAALQLIDTKKISDNEIQLHYKVVK